MKSQTVALLICFLAFRVSAFPFGNPDLDLEWEDFKQRYNKNYELDGEEQVSNSEEFYSNFLMMFSMYFFFSKTSTKLLYLR